MLSRQPQSPPQSLLMQETPKGPAIAQQQAHLRGCSSGQRCCCKGGWQLSRQKREPIQRAAEGAVEKPPLEVQSAPSAAERLEQEIATTAEQVWLPRKGVLCTHCVDQCGRLLPAPFACSTVTLAQVHAAS